MAFGLSRSSFPTVKLNTAEETILKKGGFEVKDHAYSADPQKIQDKAEELLKTVNKDRKSNCLAEMSYWSGFGTTGKNSELSLDLNQVAKDITTRGKDGNKEEAPSVEGKTKTEKVTNAFLYGLSFLSHSAATYCGRVYRTV